MLEEGGVFYLAKGEEHSNTAFMKGTCKRLCEISIYNYEDRKYFNTIRKGVLGMLGLPLFMKTPIPQKVPEGKKHPKERKAGKHILSHELGLPLHTQRSIKRSFITEWFLYLA